MRLAVRVLNEAGLHARPCHAVVSLALAHDAELRIVREGREVSGQSILELMTLGAGQGDELTLIARGPEAAQLLEALQGLFDRGFEESS